MRVLLLIRSLDVGGAERQVCTLAKGLRDHGDEVTLLTFYEGGASFDTGDVERLSLRKRHRYDLLGSIRRLRAIIRQNNYDVLHSYMPTANILAGISAAHLIPVVFGVRSTRHGKQVYGWLYTLLLGVERLLASRAALIISNSLAARNELVQVKIPAQKIEVIPNGIDTAHFRRDPAARAALREQWGVSPSALFVGRVGRLDPMKDFDAALEAFAILRRTRGDARLAIVGNGPASERARLQGKAAALGLADAVIFKPAMADLAPLYASLDILLSSSAFGEGFPNVIAEAMASGVVPVTTDVGDSALLAHEIGEVVPPCRPDLLGDALVHVSSAMEEDGERLRRLARERIVENYGDEQLIARTRQILAAVAAMS